LTRLLLDESKTNLLAQSVYVVERNTHGSSA